jgi:putative hydrolase of the HAD superfamily
MNKTNFEAKEHIFFDLDHTLWDFDKNAEETLFELFSLYKFQQLGFSSADVFIETYTRNNHQLWSQYHLGEIDKEYLRKARFANTFIELGIDPELLPASFENDYLHLCPLKTHLFPHAIETLEYLQEKYTLHLISNGFKEGTEAKISNKGTNIRKYFSHIVISENIGVHKPHPDIFQYALKGANAEKESSIMIGDSIEADIRGAQSFGMDAIFFNPHKIEVPSDVKNEIVQLKELMTMF